MRRFSFLAVLILGFLVVVAPSAYGDAVVKLVIESGIEGIVSIEGVTGIAVTMDEPADGETWGVGLSAVDDDFYGIPILAVVDEGADWTGNGWSGGEITWTGTSPILSGGTLEMWGWADDTPIASITDVVVTGYVGTVTWSVAEAADQPWAPVDTIYELTITFTPGAGAMTAIFTGEGDEVEIPTTPISGAGTVVYDADSINFTSTQGESTTWALPAPSGSGAGDFTYVMELAMDEMTEVPGD